MVPPEVAVVVGLLETMAVFDGAMETVVARLDVLLGAKELVLVSVELDVEVVELGIDMT